ncbi:MAG: hypothetical protein JST28_15805 [Acidobacteria bacterium]|nr:hypothetical protein [Acidobacteriota bacterium]
MRRVPQLPAARRVGRPATIAQAPATYQTNLNHRRHSKSPYRRLTLMMLWFLRAPLMLRPVFIAGCLFLLLASSAGAARIKSARDRAHANVARTSKHAQRAAKPAPHSARSKVATASAKRTAKKTTARRSTRSTASARKPVVPGRHLRRARYRRHSRARFVPLSTVPIRRSAAQSDFSPPVSDAGAPTSTSLAAANPAAMASAGNPLATPPDGETAPVAVGQIASLNVPRVYGRYALRGTRDSLVRQNERVELESLERIEDDIDLQNRISSGSLVRVPETSGLKVNAGLPEERRYCRQWTADFLSDLSRAHEAQFHKPLIVSSAVRTVEYQKHLMRVNRNAADAEGDIVSPHLTGATIDIAKSGLSRREMQWMRDHLFAYQTAGVIDVEEEFRQRCFHITVYKNYSPASSPSGPHHDPVPQTVPPDPSTATVSDDAAARNK